MWETADIARRSEAIVLPDDVRAQFLQTAAALEARSTIVWGEHCTECAFPACYSSCSFYAPRDDHHCRRFVHGIEALKVFRTRQLKLARIQFKRWGKLEGRGPVGLKSASFAHALERLDSAAYLPLHVPIPRRIVDLAVWRLNNAKNRLAANGLPLGDEDAFLMEAWHDGKNPLPFTLTVLPDSGNRVGMFQEAISVKPGYNRISVPVQSIKRHVDLAQPFRVQIEPTVEGTPALVFGVTDFVRFASPFAPSPVQQDASRPKIKCVVWDLDNVVWQGTLLEDGLDCIAINPDAVSTIVELDRRGILNSVASKNDPEPVLQALKHFGLLDHFVFPQIGWGPKSESIRQIAASLDIGLDTFAFVDDQPFERGEISTLCPEVEVVAETDIAEILHLPRFDVPVTAESSRRRQMYKVEEHRQQELAQSTLSYGEFLASSCIRLDVSGLGQKTALRVYELSQRTNQLNVSGQRYSRDEIDGLIADQTRRTFVLRCADRFGDYGIIGFCVLNPVAAVVDSFFMSCRVQRKCVENAFFAFLSSEVAALGHDTLRIAYSQTTKNRAAVTMLTELGFEYAPKDEKHGEFWRPVREAFQRSDIVKISSVEYASV